MILIVKRQLLKNRMGRFEKRRSKKLLISEIEMYV